MKLVINKLMMVNYNLCEYTKKLSQKSKMSSPGIALSSSRQDETTLDSHRQGLT